MARRSLLQELEIADRPNVIESALLAQHDAGGVVAAVLQPLEPAEKERLALSGPDVSDDPAHPKLLSFAVERRFPDPGPKRSSKRQSPAESSAQRRAVQPSSRRTRAATLPQSRSAFSSVGASASTRTN